MIITTSYFKVSTQLANVTDVAPNDNAGNGLLLAEYIKKYEREILTKCFSYPLFKEFKSQFDIDSNTGVWTIKSGADQKWKDLLNGTEYQVNGKYREWKGLVFTDSDIDEAEPDQSFIANYVYCKFIEENSFSHSGVGFQLEMPKNSIRMGITYKYAYAWNEMVNMICDLDNFIRYMNGQDSTNYANYQSETFEYKNRFSI